MKYTLLFLTFLMGTAVFAQQPMKFGHINTQEVLMSLPDIKTIETQMETEQAEKENQLTTLNEELTKQQQSYQNLAKSMTPEQRALKEQELGKMGEKVQNFYVLAQQQLQARQQELMAPIIQKIKNAIQEVGHENGFLYIFEVASGMPVYHSEKSVDVGALVKVKLGITN